MPHRTIINTLGYAGLIPFLVTGSLVIADSDLPGFDPLQWFVSYSAVILSFLGGVLWGRALGEPAHAASRWALPVSNAIVLIGLAGLLLSGFAPVAGLVVLGMAYGGLLAMERTVFAALFPEAMAYYKHFRLSLTGGVLLAHMLLIISLIR